MSALARVVQVNLQPFGRRVLEAFEDLRRAIDDAARPGERIAIERAPQPGSKAASSRATNKASRPDAPGLLLDPKVSRNCRAMGPSSGRAICVGRHLACRFSELGGESTSFLDAIEVVRVDGHSRLHVLDIRAQFLSDLVVRYQKERALDHPLGSAGVHDDAPSLEPTEHRVFAADAVGHEELALDGAKHTNEALLVEVVLAYRLVVARKWRVEEEERVCAVKAPNDLLVVIIEDVDALEAVSSLHELIEVLEGLAVMGRVERGVLTALAEVAQRLR